jgi:hypothetical protein
VNGSRPAVRPTTLAKQWNRRKTVRQVRNAELAAAIASDRYRGLRGAVEIPVAPSPPLSQQVLVTVLAATVLVASLWAGLAALSVVVPAVLILTPSALGGLILLVLTVSRARPRRSRPPCVRDLVEADRALREAEIALRKAQDRAQWVKPRAVPGPSGAARAAAGHTPRWALRSSLWVRVRLCRWSNPSLLRRSGAPSLPGRAEREHVQ